MWYKSHTLDLEHSIWDSNDHFKNVTWTSNAAFESQMTVSKMSSEKYIIQNVICDSSTWFESQATLFKILFETQKIPYIFSI